MKQTESGLFLPEEEKVDRIPVVLVVEPSRNALYVIASDGTLWAMNEATHAEWRRVKDLPTTR